MEVYYEDLENGEHIYQFVLTADEDSDLGYAAYYNGDLVEDFLKDCVAKKVKKAWKHMEKTKKMMKNNGDTM